MKRPSFWRRLAAAVGVFGLVAAALFAYLTTPALIPESALPAHRPDLANGKAVFHAGACLACHEPPEGAGTDAALPSGGAPFETPMGTFYPQNLTPDLETGIGGWTAIQFVNAMQRGVSPAGTHYFPAFPYASYRSMTLADVLDLYAWLETLPPVRSPAREPEIGALRWVRRGVGLWKRVEWRRPAFAADPQRGASWNRGAYLANTTGHCGECHTPRTWLLVADDARHMAGGPHPGGEGRVPSLRGLRAGGKYKDAADLTLALQHGEALGYEDIASGGMAAIQEQLAQLPEADVRAVSEYLLSLE